MRLVCLASLSLFLASCGASPGRPEHAAGAVARGPYSAGALAEVVRIGEVAVAPDGSEVAFTSDASGSFELHTLDLRDPAATPRQRTRFRERIAGLVWARDASVLAFEMDHGGNERTDLWLLRRGADAPERLAETSTAEQGARFSDDGRLLAFSSDPDREFRFQASVMDLATHQVRQLTRGDENVYALRFTRDGSRLVGVRTPDEQRGVLVVLDPTGATSERTISPPRADGILVPIDFAPDGSLLTTTTNDAGFRQLARVDLAAGRVALLGPGDWDVEAAVVLADGRVVISRNVRGESELALLAPDGAVTRTLGRAGVVWALSADERGEHVIVETEATNRPSELALLDLRTGERRTLVAAHVAGVDTATLATAERRELRSFDGRSIDAFVMRPTVARLGTPPPCVVHVHGGPNGQTRPSFSPLMQALAEAGFVVASVNYRGSTGYGRAFEDLNNGDWGGGDLEDIVSAVGTLAADGTIDRARVGITGGSYGGYMTLRAITAKPEVWGAAVDMFGMPDLVEDYRITEDRFGLWYRTEMGGTPTERAELYRDRSPVNALDRVRAPLLVLQGANDTNVPRAESDLVVERLRARRTTVDYVVYPNEGHGFTHRENRIDSMTRTVAWFVQHLGASATR